MDKKIWIALIINTYVGKSTKKNNNNFNKKMKNNQLKTQKTIDVSLDEKYKKEDNKNEDNNLNKKSNKNEDNKNENVKIGKTFNISHLLDKYGNKFPDTKNHNNLMWIVFQKHLNSNKNCFIFTLNPNKFKQNQVIYFAFYQYSLGIIKEDFSKKGTTSHINNDDINKFIKNLKIINKNSSLITFLEEAKDELIKTDHSHCYFYMEKDEKLLEEIFKEFVEYNSKLEE